MSDFEGLKCTKIAGVAYSTPQVDFLWLELRGPTSKGTEGVHGGKGRE